MSHHIAGALVLAAFLLLLSIALFAYLVLTRAEVKNSPSETGAVHSASCTNSDSSEVK